MAFAESIMHCVASATSLHFSHGISVQQLLLLNDVQIFDPGRNYSVLFENQALPMHSDVHDNKLRAARFGADTCQIVVG
jgi:hypothetical protein